MDSLKKKVLEARPKLLVVVVVVVVVVVHIFVVIIVVLTSVFVLRFTLAFFPTQSNKG
jgi:hypothetical protein